MNSERISLYLGPSLVRYFKENRGSEEYIEDMTECALNLLSETDRFPSSVPSISVVEWTDSELVIEPLQFKDLGLRGSSTPKTRLYGLLSLMDERLVKRFGRYVEEDLLERAFNGPARPRKDEDS